jgi:hypothetical protein
MLSKLGHILLGDRTLKTSARIGIVNKGRSHSIGSLVILNFRYWPIEDIHNGVITSLHQFMKWISKCALRPLKNAVYEEFNFRKYCCRGET